MNWQEKSNMIGDANMDNMDEVEPDKATSFNPVELEKQVITENKVDTIAPKNDLTQGGACEDKGGKETVSSYQLHEIKRYCGHVESIKIYASGAKLKRKIAHEETCYCRACLEKDRQEQATKAAYMAQQAGLPPLQGSEKQIAWGETIRAAKLRQLTEAIKAGKCPEEKLSAIVKKTFAYWWIGKRNSNFVVMAI